MQKPLQITLLGLDRSDALDEHVREKVRKLEEIEPRAIGCHVTIEKPHRHHHQGAQIDVRIAIRLPGRADIVVTRHHSDDAYVAMRDAFDAAKRMLEEHVRETRDRQRGAQQASQG